MFVFCL